jgi:hypothetical protein
MIDKDAALHAEWAELGLTDFSAEGYKPRLERERALAVEGKGPGAWLERFLANSRRNGDRQGS